MKPLRAQKFPCFFPFGLPRVIPSPQGTCTPWDVPLQPSQLQVTPQQILRASLTNWLSNITTTILSPLWLQPNPLQFPSAPAKSQPIHLQPSGIFYYIPQITITMLGSVQSPSSTDRVKLKVPMILESCKVIMKGSRKKPATLSRHEGPLKRRKAC